MSSVGANVPQKEQRGLRVKSLEPCLGRGPSQHPVT